MVRKRLTLPLAIVASLTLTVPLAAAEAQPSGPVAESAGDGPPPLNPAIVGVPITRTAAALDSAADAIDQGKGATAAGPLRASRRNLIRSFRGAKVLIASAPPPAEEARVSAQRFRKLARRAIRASRADNGRGWIRAQASGDPTGPVFADAPTAVFNVLTSQYDAATTAVGLLPETKGNLLKRVQATLNTAVILRNRLVQVIHQIAPTPVDDARASQESDDVTTFDVVMPGLGVLLADEIQQIQATMADTSVPAATRDVLGSVLAADQLIQNRVNTWWPPEVED
jgi:hypothetical protein